MSGNVFLEAKSRVNILDACQRYGIELNRAKKAVCPFHNEDTPSFSVSERKQIWHCFGCGEGGDVISLVAKLHRCTPLEAVKRLDSDFNLRLFDTPQKRPKKSVWQRQKKAKGDLKEWVNHANDVLSTWHRLRFMAYKDTEYAAWLLDMLDDDPILFRSLYGKEVEKIASRVDSELGQGRDYGALGV